MVSRPNFLAAIVAVSVVVATLTGCGDWYLRGTRTNSAIESAHLSAGSAPELSRALRRELSLQRGLNLRSKKDAQVIIELSDERFDRRVLSVDAKSGKVREVELGLEVGFAVRAKDGKLLVPLEKLTWVQDFIFDESSLLGTVENASTIKRELSEDAARTILLRLETIEFLTP